MSGLHSVRLHLARAEAGRDSNVERVVQTDEYEPSLPAVSACRCCIIITTPIQSQSIKGHLAFVLCIIAQFTFAGKLCTLSVCVGREPH